MTNIVCPFFCVLDDGVVAAETCSRDGFMAINGYISLILLFCVAVLSKCLTVSLTMATRD
jgi:hypothetical protein